jgi:hypothetical protein
LCAANARANLAITAIQEAVARLDPEASSQPSQEELRRFLQDRLTSIPRTFDQA